MHINKDVTVTASAWIFSYFLSALLMKYLFYDRDNDSIFSSTFSLILLLAGLFFANTGASFESERRRESACLIVFVLFDRNLLDIGNMFLILGVACIREHLHEDIDMKEIVTFICGLIYLLMGWFAVGRVLVAHCLFLFFAGTLMYFIVKLFIMALKDMWTQLLRYGNRSEEKKGTNNVDTK